MRFSDLHNDAITNLPAKKFSRYIARAQKDGVQTILISIWTTQMQNPLQQIKYYKQILDSLKTNVNLLLHIEDAWFITQQNIHELIALKPYSVGLTWNTNNNLAGGAYGNGNLTELGRYIIEELVANGIHIDLAHLNKQSFYQVAELLKTPLLCTHTCFDEVHPHPRNLDRQQIQTIVDSGGIIGLTLVNDFLGEPGILAHIEYFLKNFGDSNLSMGTDFFGTDNLPKGLRKYAHFRRLRKHFPPETLDKIFHINYHDFRTANATN